jgi:hypothetical protein
MSDAALRRWTVAFFFFFFFSFSDFNLQSTYEAVADVLKREGFFGLYSGLNSSLLGIAITNGCVSPFS